MRQQPIKLLPFQPGAYKQILSCNDLAPQSPQPKARLNLKQAAQPGASSEYAHTKTEHTVPLVFILSSFFIAVSTGKHFIAT